ncbi:hypothetical protein F4814DRAFT_423597 [Daldinia grandis]|nr:hypothetical protein F4814DRAFT_423597 [Daldinia grandis]
MGNIEPIKIDTLNNEGTSEDLKVVVMILAGKTPLEDNHMDVSTGSLTVGCKSNKKLIDWWRCRGARNLHNPAVCAGL